ncbi:SWIM zinc finger family protein [Lentisphaerota bacterium WC36G]|nr:SWIM zinc finger family protein [Lentisphaerae bacterium WC36]
MSNEYFDEFNMPQKKLTVAQRKEQIKELKKQLIASGILLEPITLSGQKIANKFWGKAWCDNLDTIAEYHSRLKVAKNYLRHGAVVDLKINDNTVTALVSGSELYNVEIIFKKLDQYATEEFATAVNGKINSIIDLLNGNFSDEIMSIICHEDYGIFPQENDLIITCNCPDYTDVCKHVAAVMFALSIKFDENPALIFQLRNVHTQNLISSEKIIFPDTDNHVESPHDNLSLDDALEMFDFET